MHSFAFIHSPIATLGLDHNDLLCDANKVSNNEALS